MSDVFYGVNMGAGIDASNVTKDTSTTSKKVELRVEDAVTGNNKKQVLLAIEAIKAKIIKSDDETP